MTVKRTADEHEIGQNKEQREENLPRKIKDHLRHVGDLKLEFNDVSIDPLLMNKVGLLF